MPLRTVLEPQTAQALLDPYRLRLLSITPLSRGTINSNYRIVTDAGPLFLRVNEGKTEHDAQFEADVLWHLNCRGLPTPPLWRTRRGEPYTLLERPGTGCSDIPRKPVMLMQWVPGRECLDEELTPEEADSVGEMLARLHRAGADFPRRRAGHYTLSHIRERIAGLQHEPQVPDGIYEFLEREGARLAEVAARQPALPEGLGHGDLFPDNLLFQRVRGRPQRAAWVLDFEQAATMTYVYDVAVTLLAFCAPVGPADPAPGRRPAPDESAARSDEAAAESEADAVEVNERARQRLGPLLLEQARALLRGYERVRPLSLLERDALYDQARRAALRFTVTRLTDVHLPRLRGAKEVQALQTAHSKDYRDYLRRLEGLMAVSAAELRAGLFRPLEPARQ